MITLEMTINGTDYVAVGHNRHLLAAYTIHPGWGRQITMMHWPSLFKFVTPDKLGEEVEMTLEEINEKYGKPLKPPVGLERREQEEGLLSDTPPRPFARPPARSQAGQNIVETLELHKKEVAVDLKSWSKELRAMIDAQGKELRAMIDAQGKELRAKIDAQGEQLKAQGKQIDAQGKQLNAKIDAQGEQLNAKIDAQGEQLNAKIDAQGEQFDTKISAIHTELRMIRWLLVALVALMASLTTLGIVARLDQDAVRNVPAVPAEQAIEASQVPVPSEPLAPAEGALPEPATE